MSWVRAPRWASFCSSHSSSASQFSRSLSYLSHILTAMLVRLHFFDSLLLTQGEEFCFSLRSVSIERCLSDTCTHSRTQATLACRLSLLIPQRLQQNHILCRGSFVHRCVFSSSLNQNRIDCKRGDVFVDDASFYPKVKWGKEMEAWVRTSTVDKKYLSLSRLVSFSFVRQWRMMMMIIIIIIMSTNK